MGDKLQQRVSVDGVAEIRRVFPIDCSNESLIEIFDTTCNNLGFHITKRNADSVVALKEYRNLLQCIAPNISNIYDPSREVIIRLRISTVEAQRYKVLTVSGEKRPLVQTFLTSFEEKIAQVGHFRVSHMNTTVEIDWPDQTHKNGVVTESYNSTIKADEAAYLYFFKIMANKHYSVGSQASTFIAAFLDRYPETSTLAVPAMQDVVNQSIELARAIEDNFLVMKHPSNVLVEILLPRVISSVERFLHEKLGVRLWLICRSTFAEQDKLVALKVEEISRSNSVSELAELCGVREEYRCFSFDRALKAFSSLGNFIRSNLEIETTPSEFVRRLMSLLMTIKLSVSDFLIFF